MTQRNKGNWWITHCSLVHRWTPPAQGDLHAGSQQGCGQLRTTPSMLALPPSLPHFPSSLTLPSSKAIKLPIKLLTLQQILISRLRQEGLKFKGKSWLKL